MADNRKVFWTMKNGTKINVDDMTEQHVRNTLKLIISNSLKGKPKQNKFELVGDMANFFNDNFPGDDDCDATENDLY